MNNSFVIFIAFFFVCKFSQFSLQFINGEEISLIRNIYSCDPIVDCTNSGVGSLVPDPDNCHNYFLCINSNGNSIPSDVVLTCPEGEAFDYFNGKCVIETTPCVNECFNHCQAYCLQDLSLIADPYDCSVYYVCLSGDEVEASCTGDFPFFDGFNCTNNIQQCCNICQPYCDSAFIETYDPFNCRNFYLCVEVGVPSPDSRYSCEQGEYFNPRIGKCDIEDPLGSCEPLCSPAIQTTDNSFGEATENY